MFESKIDWYLLIKRFLFFLIVFLVAFLVESVFSFFFSNFLVFLLNSHLFWYHFTLYSLFFSDSLFFSISSILSVCLSVSLSVSLSLSGWEQEYSEGLGEQLKNADRRGRHASGHTGLLSDTSAKRTYISHVGRSIVDRISQVKENSTILRNPGSDRRWVS